jgi:3-oxoacyl-[acyl-carrier-protein] synthase II
MRNGRRVVITGIGVVAPNGIGKQAYWDSLVSGKSGVDWITEFDTDPYPCKVAAKVQDFNPGDFINLKRAKQWGRFSQFAVAAARLALEDSKLSISQESPDRILICIGNAMNGSGDVFDVARVGWDKQGLTGIPNLSGIEFAAHAPATHVSTELHIRGQALTIASACSTGLDVVQWATDKISEGKAEIVFAGSTEAPLSEFCFATLCAFGSISTFNENPLKASRPFDLKRAGLVLGEGSAIFVVEELQHALDRNAPIYAEVLGFGTGNEAGVESRRSASQVAVSQSITSALARARLEPSQLDYVNAHGNAMPDYDRVDTEGLRSALGRAAYSTPVSSVKSMIGHAMGAAGALQVAATCLALSNSIIPPTINYEIPDPVCDLDYVPNVARVSRLRTALVNAHAIGGTYSALVLGAPDLR